MYRISPFTYIVGGMIPTGVAMAPIECSTQELVTFTPPSGSTCAEYMSTFLDNVGGYLTDPGSTDECNYCSASTTDELLAQFGISYGTRWRDFGLLWAYVIFNIVAAVGLYWLVRVVSSPSSDIVDSRADRFSRRRRKRKQSRLSVAYRRAPISHVCPNRWSTRSGE